MCLEAVRPGWNNWLKILHLTHVRRTWEEVDREAESQSKTPCWTGSSEQQGFDFMSDGEQNALDLAIGLWQGPLVLSLGVLLRRETSVLPGLSLEFGKPQLS